VGIAGMRARASEIGATISVTSSATAGSRVEVFVPPTRSTLAEDAGQPEGSPAPA
jgi:nitrate/nitrite-specific signal transduction histidine kinase